jgi:hypothetical protein
MAICEILLNMHDFPAVRLHTEGMMYTLKSISVKLYIKISQYSDMYGLSKGIVGKGGVEGCLSCRL